MTTNPADSVEEEHFRRQEAQQRREDAWDNLQQTARAHQAERDQLKAARLRPCPTCKIPLETKTLRNVEIDACSSCHGIWLDAGELEQLSREPPGIIAKLFEAWRRDR